MGFIPLIYSGRSPTIFKRRMQQASVEVVSIKIFLV
jgi:hypothetical protein